MNVCVCECVCVCVYEWACVQCDGVYVYIVCVTHNIHTQAIILSELLRVNRHKKGARNKEGRGGGGLKHIDTIHE